MRNKTEARAALIRMLGIIGLIHIAGCSGVLAMGVKPGPMHGHGVFGVAAGLTAYLLGIRHAFDADHIAAVDNVTRKLVRAGTHSWSVGFWFAIGHSTVVFALTLIVAFGVRSVVRSIVAPSSELHRVCELLGTAVSSGFLYAIAALNVPLLVGAWRARERAGATAAPPSRIGGGGLANRILERVTQFVSAPWHMYPVGVLFGLGFDTATEVALLVMASAGAASGIPWYALLSIPALFCAGMSLFDSVDGAMMALIYRWAIHQPQRMVYYNLIITALSIAVALIIGTIQVLALVSEQFGWHGSAAEGIRSINLNVVGVLVVGIFVATWICCAIIWKVARTRSTGAGAASE